MREIDEGLVRDKFGVIWPEHVETLTRFLIECRRHFRGDLDLFLVLCVIGDRTFSRENTPPEMTYDDFNDPLNNPVVPEGLNSRSIADFSGIPRETVRRKVQDLVGLGWVLRDENGHLRATDKARTDLLPVTEASFKYIVSMGRTLLLASRSAG